MAAQCTMPAAAMHLTAVASAVRVSVLYGQTVGLTAVKVSFCAAVCSFQDGNSALMLFCTRAGTQRGNKKYMNMKPSVDSENFME